MSDNCDPPTGENDVEADEGPFVWDKSEPEPDVLERLEGLRAMLKTERLPTTTINVADLDEDVADAIAEIERLQRDYITACDELYAAEGKLREDTEAEPVAWEYRRKGETSWVFSKTGIDIESYIDLHPEMFEVRALIVKPEKDTKE